MCCTSLGRCWRATARCAAAEATCWRVAAWERLHATTPVHPKAEAGASPARPHPDACSTDLVPPPPLRLQPFTTFKRYWDRVLAMHYPPALPLPEPLALPRVDSSISGLALDDVDWFMTPEQEVRARGCGRLGGRAGLGDQWAGGTTRKVGRGRFVDVVIIIIIRRPQRSIGRAPGATARPFFLPPCCPCRPPRTRCSTAGSPARRALTRAWRPS